MSTLIPSQVRDALAYMEALSNAIKNLPQGEDWGGGLRLWLPDVIPLSPDYKGEPPVAWLVANDFEGYDLATTDPTNTKENN